MIDRCPARDRVVGDRDPVDAPDDVRQIMFGDVGVGQGDELCLFARADAPVGAIKTFLAAVTWCVAVGAARPHLDEHDLATAPGHQVDITAQGWGRVPACVQDDEPARQQISARDAFSALADVGAPIAAHRPYQPGMDEVIQRADRDVVSLNKRGIQGFGKFSLMPLTMVG